MDCIAPSFRFFKFNPSNPTGSSLLKPCFSVLKVKDWIRHRSCAISLSYKTPLSPENPGSKFINFSGPATNPFRVSFPNLKSFAFLEIQKWVSSTLRGFIDSESVLGRDNGGYLQSGAFGVALCTVTSNAKVRISPFIATLAANPTFMSGLFAWMIAQSGKVFLNFFVERKWNFRILCASGGMPSSHSALCTALTTSVALCHGVADSLFPVSLGFSLIVMYDAIGVRHHAGMQAKVLNMIVEDLFQGHPISQRKLKELLGHTPSQVLAGAIIGVAVACVCCRSCLVVN